VQIGKIGERKKRHRKKKAKDLSLSLFITSFYVCTPIFLGLSCLLTQGALTQGAMLTSEATTVTCIEAASLSPGSTTSAAVATAAAPPPSLVMMIPL
jgi:ABC-type sulfate transport system permease component